VVTLSHSLSQRIGLHSQTLTAEFSEYPVTKKKDAASILFVCMGNICRSPLAEGVFRHMTAQSDDLKIELQIDSAGTHAYHTGEPPDTRAVAAAKRRGIDISMLRARAISEADFANYDIIIAMDRENHALLKRRFNPRARHVRLFMSYAGERNGDVPDPYYGGQLGFEHALDLIERGAQGLLKELRRRL